MIWLHFWFSWDHSYISNSQAFIIAKKFTTGAQLMRGVWRPHWPIITGHPHQPCRGPQSTGLFISTSSLPCCAEWTLLTTACYLPANYPQWTKGHFNEARPSDCTCFLPLSALSVPQNVTVKSNLQLKYMVSGLALDNWNYKLYTAEWRIEK